MTDLSAIYGLLAPKSVAVIGASDDPTRIGGRPIAAMLNAGYAGRILPVNPKREIVQGLPCFASVDDLPIAPEAALIAVPAKLVPATIEALGLKGVQSCNVVFSRVCRSGSRRRGCATSASRLGRKVRHAPAWAQHFGRLQFGYRIYWHLLIPV